MENYKDVLEKEIEILESKIKSLPQEIRIGTYNAIGKDKGSKYLNENKVEIDKIVNELIEFYSTKYKNLLKEAKELLEKEESKPE